MNIEQQALQAKEQLRIQATQAKQSIGLQAQQAKEIVSRRLATQLRPAVAGRPLAPTLPPEQMTIRKLHSDIDTQKTVAMTDINRQVREAEVDIDRQKEEALKAQAELDRQYQEAQKLYEFTKQPVKVVTTTVETKVAPDNSVKLDTGEYISQDSYNLYNETDRVLLQRVGVDAFNKELDNRAWQFETKNWKITNTLYMPNEDYFSLTSSERTKLYELTNNADVDFSRFNDWRQQQATATITTIAPVDKYAFMPKPVSAVLNVMDITGEALTPSALKKASEVASNVIAGRYKDYSSFWQDATPWVESQGETFLSAIKSAGKNLIKPVEDITTPEYQAKLKEMYNAEQASPWWWKIVGTGNTVVKGTKDNKDFYSPIIASEAPLISGAQTQAAKKGLEAIKPLLKRTATISAKEVGMTEEQFARFIKIRVLNNDLTPESFIAQERIFKILQESRAIPKPLETVTKIEIPAIKAKLGEPITVKKPAPIDFPSKPKVTGVSSLSEGGFSRPDLQTPSYKHAVTKAPTSPTKQEAEKIVKQAQEIYDWTNAKVAEIAANTKIGKALTPDNIASLVSKGSLSLALAAQSSTLVNAYQQASPKVKAIIEANVSPEIARALEQANATKVAALAKVQTQAITQVQTMTATATKLANSLATEGATQTQIQTKVLTHLQNQTKTIAQPQVRTEVRQLIQPITKTITQTVTRVQTRPTSPKPTRPIIPKSPRIILPKVGDMPKDIELTGKAADSIVAWKQGIMYKVIWKPYEQKNVYNSRQPVENVQYLTGVGSAAKSLIAKGIPPEKIHRHMGIVALDIKPREEVPMQRITFTRIDYPSKTTKTTKTRHTQPQATRLSSYMQGIF